MYYCLYSKALLLYKPFTTIQMLFYYSKAYLLHKGSSTARAYTLYKVYYTRTYRLYKGIRELYNT